MRTLLLTCLLTASAPALANSSEISLGSAERSLRTSSANAVTSDNLVGPQLVLARNLGEDLSLDLAPRLGLWVETSYGFGRVEGQLFDMTTTTRTNTLTVGARARYSLHRLVGVQVRGAIGAQHTHLRLEHDVTADDGAWGAVALAAAGVDLAIPLRKHRGPVLGLRFELGYFATTGVELFPSETMDEAKLSLTESQASFGSLDLQGRFFALSLFAQF